MDATSDKDVVSDAHIAPDHRIELRDDGDNYRLVIRRPDEMCTLLMKVQAMTLTPTEAEALLQVMMDGVG